MAETKTKPTDASVTDFLDRVKNEQKRQDAYTLLRLMKTITRKQPKMWGPSIIGFDKYHYRYESGREGDICMIGFSPRSQALTLYLMSGFTSYKELLKKLGKHKISKACLYINKLADIDLDVLQEIIKASYRYTKKKYD
ncbi:MAG: hypothetical protein HW386_810 [Gammaproteobacteria bacterium]|nr:hypothetical protein [Gammaproteobacteria bacterium]